MQLYRFTNQFPGQEFDPEMDHETFAGTRAGAKDLIKTVLPTQRAEHFVELVTVSNDKEGVLRMLEGRPDFIVLKRWKFTSRGALRECDGQGKFTQETEL